MMKIQIKYENENDKEKLIQGLTEKFEIIKVSDPYKTGRYSRVYLDIKIRE
ncbi:MAG: Phage protein [uncultured Clostridium sp.]